MKHLFLTLTTLTFICFSIACQQGERVLVEPKADIQADIQAIKDIVADFNVALNTGDIDKASFHMADEIVVIPPNRPLLMGKDACTKDLQQGFEQFIYKEVDVIKDVQVGGDLAVTRYTWTCETTPKSEGEQTTANGNLILVLRKQPDSIWKFIYLIYSNESLVPPEQPDPLIGSWRLNVSKSKADDPEYKMPKDETWGILAQEDSIKTTFDGISSNGKAYHIESKGKWDGKDAPVTGDPTAEAFAIRRIGSNMFEFVVKKTPGKVEEPWRVTVSEDGKVMTSVGKVRRADGHEINCSFVYDKQ